MARLPFQLPRSSHTQNSHRREAGTARSLRIERLEHRTLLDATGILYVDDSAVGLNNGEGWDDAFVELDTALAVAASRNSDGDGTNDVDTIRIADGVYTPIPAPDAEYPRFATLTLVDGVALEGGYAGSGATNPNERNVDLYETILSGDQYGDDNSGGDITDNFCTVVFAMDLTKTTTVTGLTISGGNATGSGYNAVPTHTSRSGGGVYILDNAPSDGELVFEDVKILDNRAGSGGGLYQDGGTSTFTNVTIRGNRATTGGGINEQRSTTTFENVTIDDNYSSSTGGGMTLSDTNARFSNIVVRDNISGKGGGLLQVGGEWTITNGSFTGNSTTGFGGAIYQTGGKLSVAQTELIDNQVRYDGGALWLDTGETTLVNVLIHGNHGNRQGGGISCYQAGPMTLTNVTVTNNTAGTYGGGIYVFDDPDTYLILNNSIVADNTASQAGQDIHQPTGSHLSGSHTLIGDGTHQRGLFDGLNGNLVGTDAAPIDPMFVDSADGDYRLQAISPAIDAGDNGLLPADIHDLDSDGDTSELLPVDLDAAARVHGPAVDMGCYERESSGNVLYVDDSAVGLNNGEGWDDAFVELDTALAVAASRNSDGDGTNDVDTIRIADGVYTPIPAPDAEYPRFATLTLVDGVALEGGYAGSGATNPNERNVDLYETILSGDQYGDDNSGGDITDNFCTVVFAMDLTKTTTVTGLTISGGNATGSGYNAVPTHTSRSGGGVYILDNAPSDGELVFEDVKILDNRAGSGGGLYQDGGTSTFTNVTIRGNRATTGGGINEQRSTTTFENVTIDDNYSSSTGGGMTLSDTNARFSNIVVRDNISGKGGGLLQVGGEWTITNGSFTGNSTTGFGGAIYQTGGKLSVAQTELIDNQVRYDGGALWLDTGETTLVNVLIHGNHGNRQGGGISCYQAGPMTLTNVTVTNNTAGTYGGGIYVFDDPDTYLILNNSIVADNTASQAGQDIHQPTGSHLSGSHTLIGDGTHQRGLFDGLNGNLVGTDAAPIDPMFVDSADGDYRLQAISPAIDAGDNGLLPADIHDLDSDGDTSELLPVDLDAAARVHGPAVDMGCYESGLPSVGVILAPLDRTAWHDIDGAGTSGTVRIAVELEEAVAPEVETAFAGFAQHLADGGSDEWFEIPELKLRLVNFDSFERFLVHGSFAGTYDALVIGSRHSETVHGTEEDDLLVGLGGNDVLIGHGGNDILIGGTGNDTLQGDDGDDILLYSGIDNGFDTLVVGDGEDLVAAVSDGTEIGLNGYTNGVDIMVGTGDTIVRDVRYSRTLDFSDTELVGVAEIDAGGGNDTVIASDLSAGMYRGGSGNDRLQSGDQDVVWLFAGTDSGYDTLVNDAASTTVARVEAAGTVIGVNGYENGVDRIEGLGDTIVRDVRYSRTLDFSDTELVGVAEIDAGGGNDTVIASDLSAGMYRGGSGNDRLQSGDQDVVWLFAGTDSGYDTLVNDAASTTVARVEAAGTVIGVNGYENGVDRIEGLGDTIVRDVRYSRTLDFSDTELVGVAEIDAGGGNDTVIASDLSAGMYRGGSGNDRLQSGDQDVVWLFAGTDSGYDTLVNDAASTTVARVEAAGTVIGVNGYENGVDRIEGLGDTIVRDVRYSRTLDFSDTELVGVAEIDAGGGNDTVIASDLSAGMYRGGSGNDRLQSGDQDVVWLFAGTDSGYDTLVNDAASTTVARVEAAGTVIGVNGYENGVDRIEGLGDTIVRDVRYSRTLDFSDTELVGVAEIDAGGGNDWIAFSNISSGAYRGGTGADRFVLSAPLGSPAVIDSVILDFEDGIDRIDLRALHFDAATFMDMLTITQDGRDTLISLTAVNRSIRLIDCVMGDFDNGDFLV